jgi:carbon storage regulator
MLVLSRKPNEAIIINGNIRVMVVGIRGNHVRLGIEAPESVAIFREELCQWNGVDEQPEGPPPARVPLEQTVM